MSFRKLLLVFSFFTFSILSCKNNKYNKYEKPIKEFSIGQIDYLTVTGYGEIFTTEGLQQPYEILAIEETENGPIINVYPNLSSDFVFLSVLNMNIENITYALYDVQGKLIEKQKVVMNQTSISLVDFANAIYLIRVFNYENEVKAFKIIKN